MRFPGQGESGWRVCNGDEVRGDGPTSCSGGRKVARSTRTMAAKHSGLVRAPASARARTRSKFEPWELARLASLRASSDSCESAERLSSARPPATMISCEAPRRMRRRCGGGGVGTESVLVLLTTDSPPLERRRTGSLGGASERELAVRVSDPCVMKGTPTRAVGAALMMPKLPLPRLAFRTGAAYDKPLGLVLVAGPSASCPRRMLARGSIKVLRGLPSAKI